MENTDFKTYSAVISSVGRKDFLPALLASIYSQSITPHQILLLLDDNKACHDLKESISLMDIPIEYYFCQSLNLPQKRNLSSSLVYSDVIIFSDDDDIWHPQRAEYILRAVLRGAHVVAHDYSVFGFNEAFGTRRLGSSSRYLEISDLLFASNVYGGGSGIACLREVLSIFNFDPTLRSSEDFDWWLRVLLSGANVWYEALDLVSYRRHSTNMTSRILTMSWFSSIVQLRKLSIGFILLFSSFNGLFRISARLIFSLVFKFIFSVRSLFIRG